MAEVSVTALRLKVNAEKDGQCNVRHELCALGIADSKTPFEINSTLLEEENEAFNVDLSGTVISWYRTNVSGNQFVYIDVELE